MIANSINVVDLMSEPMNEPFETEHELAHDANSLLPCPFCNSDARVAEYRHYMVGVTYVAGCTNPKCVLGPGSNSLQFQNLYDLIEQWNQRDGEFFEPTTGE